MIKRLDAKKLIVVLKHQLIINWITFIMIPATLLMNFILAMTTPSYVPAGSVDMAGLAFVVTVGLVVQGALFKYCLYNGTSRKTYFLASLIYLAIMAIAIALVSSVLSHIVYVTGNTQTDLFGMTFPFYYEGILVYRRVIMFGYAAANFGARFLWTLSISLFGAFFVWFLKVGFDALSRKWRLISMAAIVGIVLIAMLLNFLAIEGLFSSFFSFFFGFTHFGHGVSASLFSSMWSLIFAGVFGTGVWLVLRKLQVS